MKYNKHSLTMDSEFYKKYRGILIIRKKAFKEYSEKLEKEQRYVKVIRNTKFKDIDPEDVKEHPQDYKDKDILVYSDKEYYELRKGRRWPTAGYIAVGEDLFIRVERRILLIILLFFGLLLCGLLCLRKPTTASPDPGMFNPNVDQNEQDYDGKIPQNPGEQESIMIPGFFKFTATSGGKYVQLYNPDVNTVYFQYEIYNVTKSSIVEVFDTEQEALDFISENQIEYKSYAVDGNYVTRDKDGVDVGLVSVYKIVTDADSQGVPHGSFAVQEDVYSILYVTDLVSPGKQVLWDAYNSLNKGEYTLKFKISTYDVETGSECYGAIQTVTGVIK